MDNSTQEVEREETEATPGSGVRLIRKIRKYTKRRHTAEDKIRIVLEGFRKEIPVSELCRRENISSNVYYNWLKEFMEAGKARLKGDSLRSATTNEIRQLKEGNSRLKEVVADQAVEIQILKKSLL